MAQRIANRFPADLNKNQALGVSLPFNGGGDAIFSSNYTTKDQTKSNLINFFLTNKGERPFRPNFGANLRSYLFENITRITAASMATSINTALKNYEPRIEVLNTNIQARPDSNEVFITVTGRVKSTNEIIDIATTIERLR